MKLNSLFPVIQERYGCLQVLQPLMVSEMDQSYLPNQPVRAMEHEMIVFISILLCRLTKYNLPDRNLKPTPIPIFTPTLNQFIRLEQRRFVTILMFVIQLLTHFFFSPARIGIIIAVVVGVIIIIFVVVVFLIVYCCKKQEKA